MSRVLCLLTPLLFVVSVVNAEQYWIAYEGNDFPENEGWTRHTYAGGAERWLEDGSLAIDTTGDLEITDWYSHSDIRGPGLGETFVAEWRLRVDESLVYYNADLTIARPDLPGDLTIEHTTDHIRIFDDWTTIDITPGEFHSYRLESQDMDAYTLFIDGVPVYDGYFQTPSVLDPFLAFGDAIRGAGSLSRWDYVRFGIVPEPCSLILLVLMSVVSSICRNRRCTYRNEFLLRSER